MKFDLIYQEKVLTTVEAEDADRARDMADTMYPDNSIEITVKLQIKVTPNGTDKT